MGYAYGTGLGLVSHYSRCIGTDSGGVTNGRVGVLGYSWGLDGMGWDWMDWLDNQSANGQHRIALHCTRYDMYGLNTFNV